MFFVALSLQLLSARVKLTKPPAFQAYYYQLGSNLPPHSRGGVEGWQSLFDKLYDDSVIASYHMLQRKQLNYCNSRLVWVYCARNRR